MLHRPTSGLLGSGVHGVSSCDTRALLPCGMWDLPEPGLNLSLALVGRFLTPGPPGKSPMPVLK